MADAGQPLAESKPHRSTGIRRLTLALGTSQLLSWATTFYLPAVVSNAAARDLGATHAAILGGFSWSLLVTGLCAPRVGRWIGRHGGRGALGASTLVMATGLVLLAGARGVPTWYGGWTILGAGMALGLYDAAFATAGTLLGPAVSPVITGITLIAGFASTVGWPASVALMDAVGWRGMLLIYACMHVGVNLPLILKTVPVGVPAYEDSARPPVRSRAPAQRVIAISCLVGFFTARWFLTSAIAAHVLQLMAGLGLSREQGLVAAMLIGPGQVGGRILEWTLAGRLGPLARARLGALLYPAGAVVLWLGGPASAVGFAVLYGMSNGILTINRGTLPMLVLGPAGYAAILGWLALPVLLAQAAAPTVSVPLIGAMSALELLLLSGGVALVVSSFLLPLRLWEER